MIPKDWKPPTDWYLDYVSVFVFGMLAIWLVIQYLVP
jgi:hypothetical protein